MTNNIINITDIYNRFAFEWVLLSDSMKWQMPAHLLLGETSLYESGDHFANRLTPTNLDKRISAIHQGAITRTPYTVEYEMQVQGHQVASIREQGRVFFTPEGQMLLCRGYIKSNQVREQHNNEYFSSLEIIRNLDQLLEKKNKDNINAAFVYLCVDRLPLIGIKHGIKAVHKIMDQIHAILNTAVRTYDLVGRISGTSFGIILQKCGNNEIIIVAKRFTEAIEGASFKIDNEVIKLSASIGGCIIQTGNNITSKNILNHSERALLDAQHIKKIAIPTSHIAQQLETEGKKKSKKRRNEDLKFTG